MFKTEIGFIFNDIREKMLRCLVNKNILVRSIWATQFRCQPSLNEIIFSGYLIVAQSSGQGCCLSKSEPQVDFNIIGTNAIDHIKNPNSVSIALLDSLYNMFEVQSYSQIKISGDPSDKSIKRAKIIAKETARLVPYANSPTAVLIGFVSNIANELLNKGFRVLATDLSPEIIGKRFQGISVEGAHANAHYIQEADVAVVTGMVLITNTIDEIFKMVNIFDKKLLVFAQTGASLAKEYLRYGADTVVAEPFPIYDFHGESIIRIYNKFTNYII